MLSRLLPTALDARSACACMLRRPLQYTPPHTHTHRLQAARTELGSHIEQVGSGITSAFEALEALQCGQQAAAKELSKTIATKVAEARGELEAALLVRSTSCATSSQTSFLFLLMALPFCSDDIHTRLTRARV